jgi:nucleoside diphosphate kinase
LAFFFPNPVDHHETRRLSSGVHADDTGDKDQSGGHTAQPTQQRGRSAKSHKPQRTLALIRPSAFAYHQTEILQRIRDRGFQIAMHKTVHFDRAQAEDFYADQRNKPFFGDLVTEMSSGPMLVLCLVKDNAIQAWRDMLGPKEKDQVKQAAGT